MSDSQSTSVGDAELGLGEGRVQSLDDLATEYDFTAPDLYVGADGSQYVLDYGRPVVLADSHVRKPFRIRKEGDLWRGLDGWVEPEQHRRRRWRWRRPESKA